MSRLVIYGAGGFGRELRRHALNLMAARPDLEALAYASDSPSEIGGSVLGFPVIGPQDFKPDDLCVLAVANGEARRRMAERCPGFINLIATTAIVDPGIEFAEGSVVCDYTIFTADEQTKIGRHFHANFKSHVGHDCVIGDFVTLGPAVCISGNVHVGDDVYMGTGAIVRHGTPGRPIRIGAGATVGMGAVVTRDVPPGITCVGNPARPLLRDPLRVVAGH